jgi:hypothetical protein
MSIAATDLLFLTAKSDGTMSSTTVQDGANTVFANVPPSDRTTGARTTRSLYAAALSTGNELLSSAKVGLAVLPSDVGCELLLTAAGLDLDWAWAVQSEYQAGTLVSEVLFSTQYLGLAVSGLASSATLTFNGTVSDLSTTPAGTAIAVSKGYASGTAEQLMSCHFVTAAAAAQLTLAQTVTTPGINDNRVFKLSRSAGKSVASATKTTVAASAGATTMTVASLLAPISGAAASISLGAAGGYVPRFLPGDVVVVQHTNGTTREYRTITSYNFTTKVLTFSAALTNAYPIGSIVALPLALGNLQAAVSNTPFTLQAWARTWTDTRPSGSLGSDGVYSGTIGLVNKGVVTERWAIVFRSASQFDLTGEKRGKIATGNTSSDFVPLNPDTNEPFFILPASGWSSGWVSSNTVRFNTRAAAGAFDAHRVIAAGSAAGGTVNGTIFFAGDV